MRKNKKDNKNKKCKTKNIKKNHSIYPTVEKIKILNFTICDFGEHKTYRQCSGLVHNYLLHLLFL